MTPLPLLFLTLLLLPFTHAKGVIAVLQKASKLELLGSRNSALEQLLTHSLPHSHTHSHTHSNSSTPTPTYDFDIVIFCEHYVKKIYQEKLQNKTILPLKFIFVDETLRGAEKQFGKSRTNKASRLFMDEACPANGGSSRFTFGYKGMCQFWFTDFMQYVEEYDWLLRVDDDCTLLKLKESLASTELASIFPLPDHVPFAPAQWTRSGYCSRIGAVTGMMNYTYDFAVRHNLKSVTGEPKNISDHIVFDHVKNVTKHHDNPPCSILSPYTNVLYINLNWLRNDNTTLQFMKEVKETSCIFNNRWGDLELWGSIHLLLPDPSIYYNIPLPYHHKSHNCKCDTFSLSRRHKGERLCDMPLTKVQEIFLAGGVNTSFVLVDNGLNHSAVTEE